MKKQLVKHKLCESDCKIVSLLSNQLGYNSSNFDNH